jgi:hypothetical protein
MKPSSKLRSLDVAIRRAVLADEFGESQSLLQDYGAEVERCLREGPVTAEDVRALMDGVNTLVDWVGVMMQVSRSQVAAALANTRHVGRYQHAALARRSLSTQG